MAASEYLVWCGAFWNRETPEHRAEQGKETLSTLGVRLELGACQETVLSGAELPWGPRAGSQRTGLPPSCVLPLEPALAHHRTGVLRTLTAGPHRQRASGLQSQAEVVWGAQVGHALHGLHFASGSVKNG